MDRRRFLALFAVPFAAVHTSIAPSISVHGSADKETIAMIDAAIARNNVEQVNELQRTIDQIVNRNSNLYA